MHSSSYLNICQAIDYHYFKIQKHILYLSVVVSPNCHLIHAEGKIVMSTRLSFLHNLSGEPYKAYKIIKRIYFVLVGIGEISCLIDEDSEFYFDLIRDSVRCNFSNDFSAMAFASIIIELAKTHTENLGQ